MPELDIAALSRRTWSSTAIFIGVLWLLVFAPALTLDYPQGWVFWAVFSLCCIVPTWYFLRHDPALINRRLVVGPTAETKPLQKRIQAAAALITIAMFVLPGFDHRFGWSQVPWTIIWLGYGLVVLGFLIICRVFQENSFAAATIQVEAEQRVISTGLYGLVRHPMYFGAVVLYAGVPLALGSRWTLLLLVPLIAVLALRLIDEEAYLRRELPGYADYCDKVRSRLLPGIW